MANSNGTPANLRPPWKPGQSGNPGGRPKGRSLTSILREKLDDVEVCNQPCPDGRTVGETLVEVMIALALKGDAMLMRTILERVDGKVPDRLIVRDGDPPKPRINPHRPAAAGPGPRRPDAVPADGGDGGGDAAPGPADVVGGGDG